MDDTTRAATRGPHAIDADLLARLSDPDPRVQDAAVRELYARRAADHSLIARCRAAEEAWRRSRARRDRVEEMGRR